jgi:hypothetical protein
MLPKARLPADEAKRSPAMPPPSFTPSDLPKVSEASTMRASISTWRTGMSSF